MQLIIARTELQENSIKRIFEIMMKLKSRATTKQTLPSFFLSSANSQISVFSSSLTCHCSISYKLEPSSKTTLQNHTLIAFFSSPFPSFHKNGSISVIQVWSPLHFLHLFPYQLLNHSHFFPQHRSWNHRNHCLCGSLLASSFFFF